MKVIIQGVEGSFHDEVSHIYFDGKVDEVVPAASFSELGIVFKNDASIDYAVMAIENSIAGTILQNYKIMLDHHFSIVGEYYHRINLHGISHPGTLKKDIEEIRSHPMALYQCTGLIKSMPHVKILERKDTALSVLEIKENNIQGSMAVASRRAAEIYDMEIIAEGIEDNKSNYTRFFILSRDAPDKREGNKASIHCTIPHKKGSLLHVLSVIANQGVNLSKLQSYPVLGRLTEYSFHMDLEFDTMDQYDELREILIGETVHLHELGVYEKADLSTIVSR